MSTFPKSVVASTLIVLIVMVLASIEPLDWSSYLLHQAGTLIFLAILLVAYRFWHISSRAFVLASIFLIIHIIGARYLYSYVPYDEWTQQIFGMRLSEQFGWQRNMYDRLVHFSYGFLLFKFMFDGFKTTYKYAGKYQLIFLVLLFNLASSALYELFEWSLALTMSPEAAEAYNGQQGDMWDAHKDMALALLGGLIATVIALLVSNKKAVKPPSTPSNHL